MELKKMFRKFLAYRPQLKTIYLGSCDGNGIPNCAPRMLIDIIKPNCIFYVDFKSSQTYANLQNNNRASLAFMDERSLIGFKLNGLSEVVLSGRDYERANKKLSKIINSYQAERMIERIKGITSYQAPEIVLPRDYVIVKFIAEEKREMKHEAGGHFVSKVTGLQVRIDELERSNAAHEKSERAMKASRDFFKKVSIQSEKRSSEDSLTGLFNRRGFATLMEHQFKLSKRSGWSINLIYSDVDHLKTINDEFGHMTGDQLLIDLAAILKKSFRDSDIIARVGGDEFVIALINCDNERLDFVTKRLLDNLKEYNLIEKGYKMEMSMGVISYKPGDPVSLTELMNQADELMYEQKCNKQDAQ